MSQTSEEQPAPPRTPERRGDRLREFGLALGLSPQAVRRARIQLLVLAPLFAGVILLWDYRHDLFGLATPCARHASSCRSGTAALQVFVVIALVIVGWALARDFVRGLEPILFRRMEEATAGTAGFVIRLVTMLAAIVVALRIAGVGLTAIAIGASFSAVVFGLAAQQTLGNLIAGIVLLSARPFRVGDRVRLQGGPLAGRVEGVVSALGLLYTTINAGDDPVLVPNSVVLAVSVSPLREPEAVSLTVRLRPGVTPIELQHSIEQSLTVAIRRHPSVTLEELDGSEMVVTVSATPRVAADGGALAAELLEVLNREIGGAGARGDGADGAAGSGAAQRLDT
ncbi:MAG: mechanosensitive ion channel family protein [Solirubrobacteraceae bacterium]